MSKKISIPISIGFCVISLQSNRKILKKYRKRPITLQKKKHVFQKFEKNFLDSHMRNVVQKFRSWVLNGVATIPITEIDIYIDRYKYPAEFR